MNNTNEPGWVWKIFGGTILAMITLLLVTLFNIISNNVSDTRKEYLSIMNEVKLDLKDNRSLIDSIKDSLNDIKNYDSKSKIEQISNNLSRIEKEIARKNEMLISNGTSIEMFKEDMKHQKEEIQDIRREAQKVKMSLKKEMPNITFIEE